MQSMLYRLKRQTDFQTNYFFKVKTTVKDMNGITIDLPKGKIFFAEFVFTISTLVRNFLPQNVSKLINQNRHLYLLSIFQIVSRYFWENKILLVVFIEFIVFMVSEVLEKCFRKATMLNFRIRYLIAYFSSAKLNIFGVITRKHYSLKDILPSRNTCCFDKRLI